MAKSTSRPHDDEDKKIADADWLMSDAPKAKPRPTPSGPKKPSGGDHSYDVVGHDEPDEAAAPAPPVPPVPVPEPPRKPKRAQLEETEAASAEPTATVEEVWSRGAEWGSQLILVAIAAIVVAVLVYFALSAFQFLLAFLFLAVGGAVVLALCYPIFITLERPVRITPEQAAKDYFAMLSYPLPHYKRMWLLLSSAGRVSPEFSTFEEFRDHWKRTLATLQGGKAATLNPLKFEVEDFRSEKSAGATALTAKYTVKVYRGESAAAHEVASYPITAGLVKGPDRMWYLNSGTLPKPKQ